MFFQRKGRMWLDNMLLEIREEKWFVLKKIFCLNLMIFIDFDHTFQNGLLKDDVLQFH